MLSSLTNPFHPLPSPHKLSQLNLQHFHSPLKQNDFTYPERTEQERRIHFIREHPLQAPSLWGVPGGRGKRRFVWLSFYGRIIFDTCFRNDVTASTNLRPRFLFVRLAKNVACNKLLWRRCCDFNV
ncbi:hypothetical protein CDAR_585701 [Caerostris darwini]|uniref:Uncharacterized protein n=1 Tax=Caerostris darwini TaxID=1538125 RepID=A0AAV4TM08_9ARAC|nr:hypothetical protein CDAR_585701 [Caerostris darwini]